MTETETSSHALLLASILDLTTLEQLHDALRERSSLAEIIVDGSAVERVTTPCLQLLAATAKGATQGDAAFTLKNPSPALTAAIQDLGLGNCIPYEV